MDSILANSLAVYTDIAIEFPQTRVREHCLRGKMRSLDFNLAVKTVDDPRAAYLILWTAMVNRRQYTTSEVGIKFLGKAQPQFVELALKIESDIIALGYRYFPKEKMDAAIDDIEESALEFIWDSPVMAEIALAEARGDADLVQILKLPLAPFTSIGKLGNTPEAINKFNSTANDFSLVIRYFPERVRWQLEMLLLGMETSGPTAAMVKEIQNIEKKIEHMIAVIKIMPADIGEEFKKSLEATQKSLPEFRDALTQLQDIVEKSNVAIENAHQTALQANETAVQFTESAKAFEAATVEVRALLADWHNLKPDDTEEKEEKEESGSVAKDYDQMAVSIQAAAQELRTLLNELQNTVKDESTLREVTGEFQKLVNTIFWYAVALVGIIFLFALTYRLAIRRTVPKL